MERIRFSLFTPFVFFSPQNFLSQEQNIKKPSDRDLWMNREAVCCEEMMNGRTPTQQPTHKMTGVDEAFQNGGRIPTKKGKNVVPNPVTLRYDWLTCLVDCSFSSAMYPERARWLVSKQQHDAAGKASSPTGATPFTAKPSNRRTRRRKKKDDRNGFFRTSAEPTLNTSTTATTLFWVGCDGKCRADSTRVRFVFLSLSLSSTAASTS